MITKYQKLLFIGAVLVLAIAVGAYLWLQTPEQPSVESVKPTQPVTSSSTESLPVQVIQTVPKPSIDKPIPLRFVPKEGETLAFEFNTQSDVQIDFNFITPAMSGNNQTATIPKQTEKTPVAMRASGELYLKYYKAQENQWRVAAKLANTKYQLNGTSPLYAESISYPFAFRMTNMGYINDFQFTRGVPSEMKQLLQQLLYTLQTVLPEHIKSTWQTKELDMTGRYRAEYAITSEEPKVVKLTKQKREYFTLQAAEHEINPAISRSTVNIKESINTITLPVQGAWLLSIDSKEASESVSNAYVWADNKNQLSLNRIQRDLSLIFPNSLRAFLAQLNDSQYLKSKYYLTDSELDRLGANLDMNGALALFDSLKNRDISNASRDAEKFLVNYLRQHPKAAFELVDIMDGDPKRERLDQSTHLILWRLITEAGHSEAQQAIVNTLTDPERSTVTKMRALAYMSSFEYPDTATAQALWDFHQGLGTPSERTEKEFKTMSLYALGSLGYTDKLNDAVKPTIANMLTDNLKASSEPRDQMVALGAISNYGNADIIDEVLPYFTAESEGVRAAAYDSLSRMDAPRAVDTLISHYEQEESPTVRTAAAKTLSKMPPSDTGIAWASQIVLTSNAPKEQIPLVELLGKNLETYPDKEASLRELLTKNPDNKVKREVYKYIVPKPLN